MSSSTNDDQNKPVTGYPAQPDHVATGYPQAAPLPNSTYRVTAAPPPSAYYTNFVARYYYYPGRRTHSFLDRLLATILIVFLTMGVIFFIVWLVLRPRLPEFRVSSASSSAINLNTTASELTATWDLSLLATNRNKKLTVFYDRLEASVIYGGDFLLTQTELPPFSQPTNNQTVIHARLAAVGANVGDDVARAILGDQSHGSVKFGIRVLALVRFRNSGWRTRKHLMRVYCEGVSIGYSSSNGPGTLLNPLIECAVNL